MSRDHFITRTHQFLFFVALLSCSSCFQNLTARQFRNESQPVALIKPADSDAYKIAEPTLSLEDDKLIFADVDQNSIKYMCSSNEHPDVVDVEYDATSNEYEFHECQRAPNAVLRTMPKEDQLMSIWSKKKTLYQIGYEIENSDKRFSAKNCVAQMAASNPFQNKNIPKHPKGPFVRLIWFMYDDKTSLPVFVHYHLRSAQSLSIETNYIMDYNNVNPVTGEQINTDRVNIAINSTAAGSTRDEMPIQKRRLAARLGLLNRKLVPHDDLLLFSWKSAAFYGALTAPMWKMHRIKWDLVEQFVRRLANAGGDLDIYTGVTGKLDESAMTTYWTYNGNEPRALDFVIPAYFWKIVVNRKSNFGAIIVLNNNPLDEQSEKICPDIGYKNNWIFVDNDYITGSVYVCELNHENAEKLFENSANILDKLALRGLKSELPIEVLNKLINNIYWTDYELKPSKG